MKLIDYYIILNKLPLSNDIIRNIFEYCKDNIKKDIINKYVNLYLNKNKNEKIITINIENIPYVKTFNNNEIYFYIYKITSRNNFKKFYTNYNNEFKHFNTIKLYNIYENI